MSLSSVRDLFASQSRFISLTYLVPPLGVYAIAGCGGDLLINIVLTILGYALRLPHNSFLTSGTFVKHSTAADNSACVNRYIPGHLHAIYLLYVLYDRRHHTGQGLPLAREAPGVFSPEVQRGNVNGRVRIFDAHDRNVKEKPEEFVQ